LPVSATVFARRLARCLAGADTPPTADDVAGLQVADLYFVCACLLDHAGALDHLEKAHLASIPEFVRHLDPSPSFADEVAQVVRSKLLVAEPGAEAKLQRYTGKGSLRGWLAVVAQRAALDLLRQQNRNQSLDEGALERHLSQGLDPEMELTRRRLEGDFGEALRAALGQLATRERTVLRLAVVAGFSLSRIATIYRVNTSTVSRWLARARADLLASLGASLQERHRLDPADLESVVRLLRSRVDVSLAGLLGSGTPGPEPPDQD
jgi:RNA polymerase sigma-70 factor (ECF subfamily)